MSTVLIVEDNELNLKLFHDLLITQNYRVITLKSGHHVDHAVEHERPDIILMDIQLNGISGIDIIRKLKKSSFTADIPIVAITAFAMKNDEAAILAAGCDAYLSKPVSINLLFDTVNRFNHAALANI